ncbi:MAG: leucine-rich repeat domain-containing protein [Methanobrevibacter sp.]|nr:leucine-rich repeat domain-containing protein [Methanobrevibacter sp.]
MKSIDLSKTSLSSISQEMFEEDVNLKNVVLPSSVTSIGVGAFLGCTSLKSIEIPSSVTNLEYKCFKDCINMISIEIPCNVSAYGGHVFENCRSLSTIICHSSTPLNICEYQMNDSLSIFVDENKIQSYINDLNNNKYNHLSSNLLKTTYVK